MAKRQAEDDVESPRRPGGLGGHAARILVILGLNGALVLATLILGSARGGELPSLNTETLAVALLPVSAALGLLVACRRLDFSLPALVALVAVLRANPHILPSEPFTRLGILAGIAAGVCLVSAAVTWYGRISSALWTALVACGLWYFAGAISTWHLLPVGGWPWTAAVTASLGVLAAGAAVLGAAGLANPPALPPIIGSGSRGFPGLACAWIVVGLAIALLAEWDAAKALIDRPGAAYPPILAAGALGGAFILRGRWGALEAVLLTSAAHLAWAFAWSARLPDAWLDAMLPLAAPLAAIPIYLLADAVIRSRRGEGPPTGLLT